MSRLTAWLVLFVGAFAAPAQQPGEFVWRELPHAQALAVGLVWWRGFDVDLFDARSTGVSTVLAECRLARARARVKGLVASPGHVDRDFSVVIGVVPGAGETQALEFLRALLDEAPMTDDEIALVVARTALAADGAEFLYPGDVLAARARRAFGGMPSAGDSAQMAALRPDAVREQMRVAVPVTGGGAGAVTASLRAAVAALPLPARDDALRFSSLMLSPATAGKGLRTEQHSRIDQPFVMAAFQAPEKAQLAAFAVTLQVARARAAKFFRYRGSEARAHAPFVAWSWVADDPVVCFHRRGTEPKKLIKGERLEADAAAEAAATWAELAVFLDDLRDRPPSAAEVAAARQALVDEMGLVIPHDRPVTAAVLPGWLLVQLLAARRGIDAAAIAAVEPAAAHAVLVAAIASGKGCYHELLPVPRADRTWPRR